jgi:hypothetical protein
MKTLNHRFLLTAVTLLGITTELQAATTAFSCDVIGGKEKHQISFTLDFSTSTIVTSYGYTAKATISDDWIIWDDSFDGKPSQIRLSRHTGLWTRLNHSPNQGFSLPYKCKTVSKKQF